MLTPKKLGEKIKLLRESKGWSQEVLARKIKCSRTTITHIESGKRDLEVLELIKFAKVFDVDPVVFLRFDEPVKVVAKKHKQIRKINFNPKKLKNAILYILEKCGGKPNIGETVLYKLLYFSDFDSYELYNQPITGMRYVKLQYGPVPLLKDYKPVITEMEKKNEIKVITQEYHGYIQKRYIALVDWDRDAISEREKMILDSVIAKYSQMNAADIEFFVHGDAPWKESQDQQIIDYNLVFNRVPPYSHRDYSKEFRQAGHYDVLSKLGEMPKEEYDYYEKL